VAALYRGLFAAIGQAFALKNFIVCTNVERNNKILRKSIF